jgi:hypothetical protein
MLLGVGSEPGVRCDGHHEMFFLGKGKPRRSSSDGGGSRPRCVCVSDYKEPPKNLAMRHPKENPAALLMATGFRPLNVQRGD